MTKHWFTPERRIALFLTLSMTLITAGFAGVACASRAATSEWDEIDGVEQLRQTFNEDRGHIRVVLLLSPT